MVTGILINNCVHARIENNSMNGMDTAIEIYNSVDIQINDTDLRATRTAIAGERVRGLTVNCMTHSEAGWLPRPTALATAIQRIAHGHV